MKLVEGMLKEFPENGSRGGVERVTGRAPIDEGDYEIQYR